MKILTGILGSIVLLAAVFAVGMEGGNGCLVYFGTYTRQESKGIYVGRFDAATGKATSLGLAAETSNPSFLALHPNRRFLYAVNEVSSFERKKGGSVSAYAVDGQSGQLKLLNVVFSRGDSPCHLTVDRSGKWLLVANYGTGSVAVFPVRQDGSLGESSGFVQHVGSSVHPQRQQGPHAHQVILSADNRFAFVPDLGLDKLMVYRFDAATGVLTPGTPAFVALAPGSGPRHAAFHPDGRLLFVINELKSTVTAFAYNPLSGALKERQTVSTLPADFSGPTSCAEIEAHPAGRFLYGSNRGHDSIVAFAVGPGGLLTNIETVSVQGKTPRNFAIDPTGGFLFSANQSSGSVVIFRIDRRTGRLSFGGEVLEVPSPVCVTFLDPR